MNQSHTKLKWVVMTRFDEEPERDIHDECTFEIKNLECANRDLKEQLAKENKHKITLLNYCRSHADQMWASTVIAVLLDCDFRDSAQKAKEYLAMKEGGKC